jgi:hypothetical protein
MPVTRVEAVRNGRPGDRHALRQSRGTARVQDERRIGWARGRCRVGDLHVDDFPRLDENLGTAVAEDVLSLARPGIGADGNDGDPAGQSGEDRRHGLDSCLSHHGDRRRTLESRGHLVGCGREIVAVNPAIAENDGLSIIAGFWAMARRYRFVVRPSVGQLP